MSNPWYVILLICSLFNLCRLPTSTAQRRSVRERHIPKQSVDVEPEEPLDPALLILLQREQRIVVPFAWGGPKQKGIVIGIDEDEKLKTVYFGKTDTGYVILNSQPFRLLENQFPRIKKSGLVDVQNYLADREFPLKADVISMEHCQVHFIAIERALSRSLRNAVSPLTATDVRIIVEKDSKVISSENAALTFFGVREAFVTDINGDGNRDYVFVGEDNSKFIYVWTVEANCTVKPMLFQFEEDRRPVTERYVSGGDVFLTPDKATGGYTVHTRSSEPYVEKGTFFWRITESVYQWQSQQKLYKRVTRNSWLEKDE